MSTTHFSFPCVCYGTHKLLNQRLYLNTLVPFPMCNCRLLIHTDDETYLKHPLVIKDVVQVEITLTKPIELYGYEYRTTLPSFIDNSNNNNTSSTSNTMVLNLGRIIKTKQNTYPGGSSLSVDISFQGKSASLILDSKCSSTQCKIMYESFSNNNNRREYCQQICAVSLSFTPTASSSNQA